MVAGNVNLLEVVGSDTALKKVASTNGGEYHGACPRCGGVDRFIVQPFGKTRPRWSCRQCRPKWGDAVDYVRWRDDVDFKTALTLLGLQGKASRKTRSTPKKSLPVLTSLTNNDKTHYDDRWQVAAHKFIEECHQHLLGKQGLLARKYLEGRGIAHREITAACLGYNPRDQRPQWADHEMWLPRGIVIPSELRQHIYRINIRRPKGEPKYVQASGGESSLFYSVPYRYSPITHQKKVIVCEGELDALALLSNCAFIRTADWIVVATASTGGARRDQWLCDVATAQTVLLAFDADEEGDKAAAWWAAQPALQGKTIRLRPKCGKDLTDTALALRELSEWVQEVLEKSQNPAGSLKKTARPARNFKPRHLKIRGNSYLLPPDRPFFGKVLTCRN